MVSRMTTSPISRRQILLGGTANLVASQAFAQSPGKPVTIVVPFTPGTGIDILARVVADEMQKRLGQAVVVENKPGASGNIGSQSVARSEPDGNTLMMTVNTFVMNASLFKSLPYDPQKSFAPIIEVATGSMALVVTSSLTATTVEQFIAEAKARPEQINYASPGRGTPQHLAMELFKVTAGISLKHVPYSGSAGAVKDLVGGHVQAMFLPLHTTLPLVAEKQIRILAIGSASRAALAPDVKTLKEQGMKDFDVDLWFGLLAPAATPQPILTRYHGLLTEILAQPSVREALGKQGLDVKSGSPQQFADLIAEDLARWARVVREANIAQE